LVGIAFLLQAIRSIFQAQARTQALVDFQLISLQLLWIVHPMICLELLEAFKCTNLGGQSYLVVDMSVNCSSSSYVAPTSVISLYLAFYCALGTLLFYIKIIQVAKNGDLFDPHRRAMRKYAFFVRGYKKENYLWEMWILLKKLGIIALISFVEPGLVLVWTAVLLSIFIYLHLINQPHVSELVNRLEMIALLAQQATVVMGFHFFMTDSDQKWASFVVLIVNIFVGILLFLSLLRRVRRGLLWINECLPERFRLDEEKEEVFTQMQDPSTAGGGDDHEHKDDHTDNRA